MKRQTVGTSAVANGVRTCWCSCSCCFVAAEKLRSYFGAYGSVTDAVVMKDPISRRSRGFGFITYADPVCVDRALAQPNHILDSRRVSAYAPGRRDKPVEGRTSTHLSCLR